MVKTKDPVNQVLIEEEKELGLEKFGLMNSYVWRQDPKRLVFTLSRYKLATLFFMIANIKLFIIIEKFCSFISRKIK